MAESGGESLDIWSVSSVEEATELLKRLQIKLKKLAVKLKNILTDSLYDAFGSVKGALKDLSGMLLDAFTVDSVDKYREAAAIYGEELAGALYSVQLRLEGLKAAVIRAAAPIAGVLVPVVSKAIQALTALANAVAQVLQAVFGVSAAYDDYTESITGAVTATGKLNRALADFDEIERLGSGTAAGGLAGLLEETVSDEAGALAQKLQELLEPLKKIDLGPAAESLERFKKALEPITKALFEALEWAWYNILVPLAEWTAQELLPVFLDTLTVALEQLAIIIEELKPSFIWLWENCLQQLLQWKGDSVIAYLQGIANELSGVGGVIQQTQTPAEKIIQSLQYIMAALGKSASGVMNFGNAFQTVLPAMAGFMTASGNVSTPLLNMISAVGGVKDALGGLIDQFAGTAGASGEAWESIESTWGGVWNWLKEALMDPSVSGVKGAINNILGLINAMSGAVTKGLNGLIEGINKLTFTVPSWVPLLGGKSFVFDLPALTAPKIPMLARGAVLPANKPFLAMVGDQKHGTNVEAPLSTIQEAVAAVMEDYAASNLAGHEATVAVLRELLAAVLGIQIGDDVIAGAVQRYDRKMAVVRGG